MSPRGPVTGIPSVAHTIQVARVLRILDLSMSSFLIPVRVRLGAAAYQACNPRQMEQRIAVEAKLMLPVIPDAQLLPDEAVVDVEGRTGGFDEDLLTILSRRVGERIEQDEDLDVVPTCRGNRPAHKGNQ